MFEEAYEVDDRGNIKTKKRKIPFENNLKSVVKIIGRVRPDYELDYNHPGWNALKDSLKVRHRLAHPKDLKDLEVTDQEITDAQRGFTWFLSLAIEVMYESNNSLKEKFLESLEHKHRFENGHTA